MNHDEYRDLVVEAARRTEAGDHTAAAEILHGLLAQDLPDHDKSVMSVNLAIVCDRMGEPEESLRWYDCAIEFESRTGSFWALESKACYLAVLGQYEGSRRLYELLLGRSNLSDADRTRLENNICSLNALSQRQGTAP
jgi:tetratricopeptide (TPR) repeat protein